MEKIFHRIEQGEGDKDDLDLIVNVSSNIMGNTICPLATPPPCRRRRL